jgi:hypothetical protein
MATELENGRTIDNVFSNFKLVKIKNSYTSIYINDLNAILYCKLYTKPPKRLTRRRRWYIKEAVRVWQRSKLTTMARV